MIYIVCKKQLELIRRNISLSNIAPRKLSLSNGWFCSNEILSNNSYYTYNQLSSSSASYQQVSNTCWQYIGALLYSVVLYQISCHSCHLQFELTTSRLQIIIKRQRIPTINNGQSRETGNIGYTRRRNTNQKYNAISVGHHYAQIM